MTHTTTDAAEARASEVDRIATLLLAEWKRIDPDSGVAKHTASYVANFADMARVVIADRLATAEAASGAGEREVDAERLTMAVARCFSGMPERMANEPVRCGVHHLGTLWTVSGDIASAIVASLPPATDPAMVAKQAAAIVERGFRCRTCDVVFVEDSADIIGGGHPDNGCAGPNWCALEDEGKVAAIRALAAAPTIPATGETE